jgi:hypothetical protein
MTSFLLLVVFFIAQVQCVASSDSSAVSTAVTTSTSALSIVNTFEGGGLRGSIHAVTQSLKSSKQFGVQQANTVEYNGYTYSTLADVDVMGASVSCQNYLLELPDGWAVAPDDSNSQAVIHLYPWNTHVVVVANGNSYGTSQYVLGLWNAGMLTQSGDFYATRACSLQILIYYHSTTPTESPTESPTETPTESPTETPTAPTHAPTAKHGTMAFHYRRGTALTASNFNCMKSNGFSHFIPRAYTTSTTASGVDRNICHHLTLAAVQNLHNKGVFVSAKPAYGLSAREPMREVKKALLQNCGTYSDVRVWIQVLENGQDNYGWLSDTSANQAWFEQLLTSCKNHFTHCGVMASQNAWATVFGSSTYHNADVFSGLPLWYSNTGSRASYADFGGESVTIGAWSNADMKQYDAVDMCDVQVGLDWAK